MSEMSTFVKPYSPLFQGFSKVTECLPHPTPKREKERGTKKHLFSAYCAIMRLTRILLMSFSEQKVRMSRLFQPSAIRGNT